MTPEGRVKEAVKARLKEAGAYKHMPVQNGMGEPALDFHVCHRGHYAAIETKAEGKLPTPRQLRTIQSVLAAGGSVFVIDKVDGPDMADLIMWLAFPTVSHHSPIVTDTLFTVEVDEDESRNDRRGDPEHSQRREVAKPGSGDL